MATTGRCLCGGVQYAFEGLPLWVAYCHCESCRRHTSSPVAAFVGVRRVDLTMAGRLRRFESTPGIQRTSCESCGSPISYEAEARFPGEVHLYLGTLDRPADMVPTAHVHTDEQLPWFELLDHLPRFAGSGSAGGAAPVSYGPQNKNAAP